MRAGSPGQAEGMLGGGLKTRFRAGERGMRLRSESIGRSRKGKLRATGSTRSFRRRVATKGKCQLSGAGLRLRDGSVELGFYRRVWHRENLLQGTFKSGAFTQGILGGNFRAKRHRHPSEKRTRWSARNLIFNCHAPQLHPLAQRSRRKLAALCHRQTCTCRRSLSA